MAMSIDRRGFLGLAGIAGASLFLAGCVGQAAPAPSAPGASLGPAAADATGNISYWNHFTGEDERRGFEAVTKGFAEAYPGLKLKEESIPNADFMTKFTTAAQAGSLPDSVMVHANRVQDLVGMNGLVDLSSAMDSWSGASDIEEKLLTPFRRDGALYAIPCTMFVDWFYYRADWLEELGYSEPPKTWQEFREVAKAMTSGGSIRRGAARGSGRWRTGDQDDPRIQRSPHRRGRCADARSRGDEDRARRIFGALSRRQVCTAERSGRRIQPDLPVVPQRPDRHAHAPHRIAEVGHRRAQDRRAGTHCAHADYSRRHHGLAAADGQRHREPR